jgi:predicted O-methyltransferase YrrM
MPLSDLYGSDPKPMTLKEAAALGEAVMQLRAPAPVIVQIGAYIGASTVAILRARPDTFIFSVDIKAWGEEFENVAAAGLPTSQVVRVLGESAHVGAAWPYPVDMVLIDGDHRYDYVKVDILTWMPKVCKGGLLAFHDYIVNPKPPIKGNVAKAVDELVTLERVLWVERLKVFRR